MSNCVGGDRGSDIFVRGSSKPKEEKETIESQIKKKLTAQHTFKCGSKSIPVEQITQINNVRLENGNFLDDQKNHWNTQFSCEADLDVPNDNGCFSEKKTLIGYAQIEDGECKEISEVIRIK